MLPSRLPIIIHEANPSASSGLHVSFVLANLYRTLFYPYALSFYHLCIYFCLDS